MPYHRSDTSVIQRRPQRSSHGMVQEDGNPHWNANWTDLINQTPTWVRWQIGGYNDDGPTIDGYEFSSCTRCIHWTAEVLDMTRQRIDRHIHAEITIHHSDADGTWEDNSIVEETPAFTGWEFGEISANSPVVDIQHWMSHGINKAGVKLGSDGWSFSSVVSGEPGFYMGRLKQTVGDFDWFKLHLSIGDRIWESPPIHYPYSG
jgi:hypothetical protein